MKWILFFATLSLFSTETLTLSREDGSELFCYCDEPSAETYPIALLVVGSQKETSLRLHEALKSEFLDNGFCPITLEKRGVGPDFFDEGEFNMHLDFCARVSDHLLLHKKLNALLPAWDGQLVILGQGDGGRVGARFATFVKNLRAIALIASGGGWPPQEEILYSFRSQMSDQHFSPRYIHGFLVQAKEAFRSAEKYPTVGQTAFGYPYKYWESFLKTSPANDLSRVNCPILSINGTSDDRVPIESVELLAKSLKERMLLICKDKRGREILQDQKVYKEAISWFAEKF